jgi:Fe-S-cluster containining protein
MSSLATDPGLLGVVPFTFECHRCGRCCSGERGFVWLEEEEIGALSSAMEMEERAFLERYVRSTPNPRTGVLRLSLLEEGGRCALLVGTNQCAVYTARPEHCRQFPYWPSVLEDPVAFESARETCPGIAVQVHESVRERAFAALEELYEEVDAFVEGAQPVCTQRGVCCRFEEAGHELYATALEADYAAARAAEAQAPEGEGRCPYHVGGKCTARAERALGCRTYFCDKSTEGVLAEAHERFLARIRGIELETGYPAAYGRFPALLTARGVGVEDGS